ncbi:RNA methyltransferase [Porticoccus sp. W117]|uniref:TrmH family RNA methyltransferase n=1 Tax=Porticoccus sp. W117 TaxID=3054777 RepID=UPI0025998DD8|nr:RNA methyltransferase [Porticoccus sp. W117]MDM3872114.1 RNA methyltransferase [Porticoccus sp. W117]
MSDKNYQDRKRFFDSLLTIYGRKPVLEALRSPELTVYRLHLADSNRMEGTLKEIVQVAQQRGIEILYHSRKELARISRNGKQDQGVAADLQCSNYRHYREFLQNPNKAAFRVIALDGITNPQNQGFSNISSREEEKGLRYLRLLALCGIHNPQNLGMIIRSACAGNIDGILIPKKGCSAISPLVIKASVGTLFKAPILACDALGEALNDFKNTGFSVCVLSSHAQESLFEHTLDQPTVYVLGNESEGVSDDIFNLADKQLMIPMNNGVESLNVAVTAALIAFSC